MVSLLRNPPHPGQMTWSGPGTHTGRGSNRVVFGAVYNSGASVLLCLGLVYSIPISLAWPRAGPRLPEVKLERIPFFAHTLGIGMKIIALK